MFPAPTPGGSQLPVTPAERVSITSGLCRPLTPLIHTCENTSSILSQGRRIMSLRLAWAWIEEPVSTKQDLAGKKTLYEILFVSNEEKLKQNKGVMTHSSHSTQQQDGL